MKRLLACLGLAVVAGGAALSAKDDGSLAARVQRIEDRQAIEQLMAGDYLRALDSSNWKVYASFFAGDGELIVNGTSLKGPAAIEPYYWQTVMEHGSWKFLERAIITEPAPAPPAATPSTR